MKHLCRLLRHPYGAERTYLYGSQLLVIRHCWCGAKGHGSDTGAALQVPLTKLADSQPLYLH